jgi:hypothetical protein
VASDLLDAGAELSRGVLLWVLAEEAKEEGGELMAKRNYWSSIQIGGHPKGLPVPWVMLGETKSAVPVEFSSLADLHRFTYTLLGVLDVLEEKAKAAKKAKAKKRSDARRRQKEG